MTKENFGWLRLALQVKGSVIPSIALPVLCVGIFGFFVSILHQYIFPISNSVLGSVIPSVVIGLLLVFRTNTAYDRFWEGRKLWGQIVINCRNLAAQMWVAVDEHEIEDRDNKKEALKLLTAVPVALKLHLRSEPVNSELEELILPDQYVMLKSINHPTLGIILWIRDYIQKQSNRNCLNPYQMAAMQGLVNDMVAALTGCERILRTPLPPAYVIHIKQLVLLYCLFLPFPLVKDLNWWTGPVVALISFTLLGIEEIGVEIENPFGYDANDLPLDTFCATVRSNITEIMSFNPSVNEIDTLRVPIQYPKDPVSVTVDL